MKIGLVSRHCESCDKDVFDFTKLSREEILLYLLQNRHKQVCARIFPSQIDYHHQDLAIAIESLLSKHKNSNLAFYLLTIGSLALLGCDHKNKKEVSIISAPAPIAHIDSAFTRVDSEMRPVSNDSSEIDTLQQKFSVHIPDISSKLDTYISSNSTGSPTEGVLLGFITSPELGDPYRFPIDDPLGVHQPPTIAEVMPEFVGGFDSLVSFLRKNTKYPQQEKENSIEGTTYVSAIINEDGKIIDPIILKSATENFDAEALRVVSMMPDWIPAENKGTKTAVRYVIPIKFKI